jgi:hypothetical protein
VLKRQKGQSGIFEAPSAVQTALALRQAIVYAGSKLALSNQWKNTALWELSGVEGKVDVDQHCYLPMDRLLERQSAIQRTLAVRHFQDGLKCWLTRHCSNDVSAKGLGVSAEVRTIKSSAPGLTKNLHFGFVVVR